MEFTKEYFFSLPTNKKTVEILYNESRRRFNSETEVATCWFFNEVATCLKEYIGYRKCIKSIVTPRTTESVYNDLLRVKSYGYRKELVIPF